MTLDVETFVRGFVAGLINSDATAIRLGSRADRRGLRQVLNTLETEIQRSQNSNGEDKDWYRYVVRLRNELRPSNNGTFDNFEMALRNLQLSLTSCPNPFYEEIAFSVSKPYAQSIISELPNPQQKLVAKAVEAFLGARKDERIENGRDEHRKSPEPCT